jgi:hypothetical protein
MIVAVDDVFVVPIPTPLHPLGFFKANESPVIVPGEREEVARKLTEASSGRNAVTIGAGAAGARAEGGQRAGRGQRGARQLRQARQRLSRSRHRAELIPL